MYAISGSGSRMLMPSPAIRVTVGQVAGGWTPPDIPGCILWLDASQITGLNDGDAVGTWSDLSVSTNDATQATAAKKPTYKTNIQNGLPVVRFDGSLSALDGETSVFTGTASRTIFVVYHGINSDKNVHSVFGQSPGDGPVGGWCVIQARDAPVGDPYGAAWGVDLTGPARDWIWKIATLTYDGTTATLYKNGTQINTGILAWNTSDCVYTIGTSNGSADEHLTGDVAEIIVYNTALSAPDRGLVETYLSAKWDIAVA